MNEPVPKFEVLHAILIRKSDGQSFPIEVYLDCSNQFDWRACPSIDEWDRVGEKLEDKIVKAISERLKGELNACSPDGIFSAIPETIELDDYRFEKNN